MAENNQEPGPNNAMPGARNNGPANAMPGARNNNGPANAMPGARNNNGPANAMPGARNNNGPANAMPGRPARGLGNRQLGRRRLIVPNAAPVAAGAPNAAELAEAARCAQLVADVLRRLAPAAGGGKKSPLKSGGSRGTRRVRNRRGRTQKKY